MRVVKKSDALVRGNYRDLKMMDHVMKTIKRMVEAIIKRNINIDEMQCGFMPGRCTTDIHSTPIARELHGCQQSTIRGLC